MSNGDLLLKARIPDLECGKLFVSVIIPARNAGNDIGPCLAALSSGTRVPDEIIVVDVLQVALPIKIWELTGNGSIVGTAKFIWDPPDS